MYGKVKLSKRQIKEDKFTAFMLNAKQQFLDNWQFYVIGLVAFVLVIVAVDYYVKSQGDKKVEANARLSEAVWSYRQGNVEVGLSSLSQITNDYSGPVAEQATFLLAKLNFENGNYSEATLHFESYLNKYKDNLLNRASAYGGQAAILENQASYTEAASKFTAAYNEYPDGPSSGDYHLGALRNNIEASNFDAAAAELEIIRDSYKNTVYEGKAVRLFTEKNPN